MVIWLGILASLLTLAIGYAIKVWLDWRVSEFEITKTEFVITSLVMICLVIPGTLYVGKNLAVSNNYTFYENWNGWETEAVQQTIKCAENGYCQNTYSCNPYTVPVPYDCGSWDGKDYRPQTCIRYDTHYNSCPYVTHELRFSVKTTLGDYYIAYGNVPDDADSHRWDKGIAVPASLPKGTPPRWSQVKARLDERRAGPVTMRRSYDNYILASQRSRTRLYSPALEQLKAQSLLPKLSVDVKDFYFVDRFYVVGVDKLVPKEDISTWQSTLARFNAALGMSLQGDLQVVIVDAAQVGNPDSYIGALTAYWQSDEFEQKALSKNALVLVLATHNGKTVEWARMSTGMPFGNETMLAQVPVELAGVSLDATTILGEATADTADGIENKTGALGKIVWGPNKFKRVHMKPRQNEGGFTHLISEIEPTTNQMIAMMVVIFILGFIAWGFAVMCGSRANWYRRYH